MRQEHLQPLSPAYRPSVPSMQDPQSIPLDPVPPLHAGRISPCPLRIVVIGCGLGGLSAAHTLAAAGHNVTLLEAAPVIREVGAGIQVSPNATRLLIRWGLGTALHSSGVKPQAVVFRRYESGERVGYTRWGDSMDESYGAPYLHVHRADYHAMLLKLATSTGRVKLRLGCTVIDCNPDPSALSVTLQTGEIITEVDLIIGADGVKSLIQGVVTGKKSDPRPTGDAAYRAIIPCDILRRDPELRPFVETPEMTAWMAPKRHLMAYCIRGQEEYNLVLLHPDDGSVESWNAEGSADVMRADFADFEPRVQKLLSHVKTTLKWRLMDREALDTWVHPQGRVVLLGDSCHPMLPYRAQGAAMAIEDASVLGSLFSHLSSVAQIPTLLNAYQAIRLPRTSEAQQASRLNQYIFHLPDGPEQQARDAAMREAMTRESSIPLTHVSPQREETDGAEAGNPNSWADKSKSVRSFGYDAEAEVDTWWQRFGDDVEKIRMEDQGGKIQSAML